ncbi:hypothetical protein [Ktedonobacter sp. SOSP1-52]|uniref:hypothetical protein n=1 Tax=Ktedonobacter sp. SOSP1-52 TaxID=2778366 RepID=UPI00191569D2|nr:hypothetical protein [Ktedonobacter sp. SOSP1-52]
MGKRKPTSIVLAPPRPTHAPSCWQRQGQASRKILIDASAESIAGRAGLVLQNDPTRSPLLPARPCLWPWARLGRGHTRSKREDTWSHHQGLGKRTGPASLLPERPGS